MDYLIDQSLGLGQLSSMLPLVVVALLLSVWFKRPMLTSSQLLLVWLWIALLGAALNESAANRWHDVVELWLPINLLLLALLPRRWLSGLGGWVILLVGLAQLVLPFVLPSEWAQSLLAIPSRIDAQFEHLSWFSFAAVLTVLATIVALGRWVLSQAVGDLALGLIANAMLLAQLRPEWLGLALVASATVGVLAVIYGSHQMAFVDALTGVGNRRALDSSLQRLPKRFAIAMLDIDHFKRINDKFGHEAGDQVLRMVAGRVCALPDARLFRFGGEEFCLIFKRGQVRYAEEFCEQARAAVADTPFVFRQSNRPAKKPRGRLARRPSRSVTITVSLGLADKLPGQNASEVMARADKALYRAKRNGRNRVAVAKK